MEKLNRQLTMKKLIQTKDYLLLIQEEAEIKEGNIAIHDFGMGYDLEIPCDKDNLKSNTRKLVIAYYPLTEEAKELDLPWLPNPFEGDIDVEKLADTWFEEQGLNIYNSYDKRPSFIAGYKAAQSSNKQFTLEDMKKAIEMARTGYGYDGDIDIKAHLDRGGIDNYNNEFKLKTEEEIIQSLSTQQLPKEFIPEYEEIEVDKYVPKMTIDKLKTITNSESKQVLVGTYKY